VFLVVDDFETMRKITANQLRTMGADTVLTASNGAEALRILQSQRVDMVLSDWNMPAMSGLELLKNVRAHPKLAATPFLMVTAEAGRDRVAEAIAHGVSDLLVKPYTAQRLSARVERALVWTPGCRRTAAPVATRPHANARAMQSTAQGKCAKPCLLVVDDTPDNLHLLAHLFKDEYGVRVANHGEKALAFCCSDDPPDLVLLDIMMPDMDGFEVARRMREHPTAQTIPIIFVTAMAQENARLQGLELGAVDVVSKPIEPEVLRLRVHNFMRYVELRKQLQADFDTMLESAQLREDVELITRHDLKAPLAGVIGLVQSLMANPPLDSTALHQQLRLVEETALQTLDLINLSSELYKIETGRFTLNAQPIPLFDILRRVAELARASFATKPVTVVTHYETPSAAILPLALGDAMLCHSLFHNLVKNACEASPPVGMVSITLLDQSPLRVVIENRGVVPASIRDRFFEKFVTQGNTAGTGLGTYSAQLLAQAQSGCVTLEVHDATDTTRVTVELPRCAPLRG
jgi:CheY-like chemotaxis protein